MKTLFFFLAAMLLSSCSDKEPNLNKDELLLMLRKGDPQLEVIVPPDLTTPIVHCSDYLPPCRIGYLVKIKKMEVVGLYYEDQEEAFKSARSIRGYHLRNWAFDKVSGEPILERFFQKHLGAKKVE